MAIYGSRGVRATKKARPKKKIGTRTPSPKKTKKVAKRGTQKKPKKVAKRGAQKKPVPTRKKTPASKQAEKVVCKKRKLRKKAAPVKKRAKAAAGPKKRLAAPVKRARRVTKATAKTRTLAGSKKRKPVAKTKAAAKKAIPSLRGARTKKFAKAKPKAAAKKPIPSLRGAQKKKRPTTRQGRLLAKIARLEKKLDKKLDKDIKSLVALQQVTRGRGKKSPAKKAVLKRRISNERIEASAAIANVPQTGVRFQKFTDDTFERMKKRFPKLLGIATIKGQTPKRPRLSRRVNSKKFKGEQRRVSVGKILTPGLIPTILYKVDHAAKKMSGTFALWAAKLAFSGFGERLIGSANQILRADDPDARYFQAAGWDTTGIFQSFRGMRDSLEGMLEDYAGTLRTVVYLHFIELRNVSRKT